MKPAAFQYHRPASLDQALGLLAGHGAEARVIAGGQSLVPMMNLRMARPEHLIDLRGIPGLAGITEEGGALRIGALVTHQTIATSALVAARCPMLSDAAATIAHYAIRTQGTIGGSLAHADPAAQFAAVVVALQADLTVSGPSGGRRIASREFFQALMMTALEADEILTAVSLAAIAPGQGQAFRMFGLRHGDFAVATVAADIRVDAAGMLAALRLVVGGVAPTPVVLDALAADRLGKPVDDRLAIALARQARAAIEPFDTPGVSVEFRREQVEVLVADALGAALSDARAGNRGSGR
ncbi:MAG: xanthine dehydrogenase family protein subunit M [Burkholderiaceae bacterium]